MRRLGLLTAALIGLGGCSMFGSSDEAAPQASRCPDPGIINGLGSTDHYKPGLPQEPDSLLYSVALLNIQGGCQPEGDDLVVTMSVDIKAEAGPRYTGGLVDVPYFVAVVGPNNNVVDRQDYAVAINLPGAGGTAGTRESFTQRYPGLAGSAAGYRTLFGLVLPREEALRQRQLTQ